MNTRRVLVVDDEAYVVHVLRQYLERDGYTVRSAHNGHQALEVIDEFQPQVVITDFQMPRMNGQELCEALVQRPAGAAPCLVVMTSRTDRDLRTWTATLRNVVFIEKPVSPRRVLEHVGAHFATEPVTESA